jgi:hypothetical protein
MLTELAGEVPVGRGQRMSVCRRDRGRLLKCLKPTHAPKRGTFSSACSNSAQEKGDGSKWTVTC